MTWLRELQNDINTVSEELVAHKKYEDAELWESTGRKGTRLRFDLELSDKSQEDGVLDLLIAFTLLEDLEDLVLYGDTGNSKDALLRLMDGAAKRNKQPTLVKITNALLYEEYKQDKKSTEYTIYVVLYTEW